MAVTPLVFDLRLSVDPSGLGGAGWRVLHVYGSPNPNDTALSSDGAISRVCRQGSRQRMHCTAQHGAASKGMCWLPRANAFTSLRGRDLKLQHMRLPLDQL